VHDDLKALLRAGWQFGLRNVDGTDTYRATGKREAIVVRGDSIEPLEALARAILEAQQVPA
jgi:hypothetical protein